MRRLGWISGMAGGIAAYRWLRRRPQIAAEPMPAPPPAEDPAEELRAKLAESRTVETMVDEPPPPEPVAEEEPVGEEEPVVEEESVAEEEPAADPDSPEDRRRLVHEEGRAALDEMKSDGTDS